MIHGNLTSMEILQGAMNGVLRRCQGMKKAGRYGIDNASADLWTTDIHSSCAEMAVAKYLRRYWAGLTSVNTDPDDVSGVQVRWTPRTDGRLILHETDPDVPFVLVTGTTTALVLRGWILPRDGRRKEWWCDPSREDRWAFFVPQAALHQMDTLGKFLNDAH